MYWAFGEHSLLSVIVKVAFIFSRFEIGTIKREGEFFGQGYLPFVVQWHVRLAQAQPPMLASVVTQIVFYYTLYYNHNFMRRMHMDYFRIHV